MNVVLLKFNYNQQIRNMVRELPGATFSFTHKAWYVPFTISILHDIKNKFSSICTIDAELLKTNYRKYRNSIQSKSLNADAVIKIEKFKSWLRSRRYSESTVETYSEALKTFLRFYCDKQVNEITNEDVITFNNKYILENKFSSSFQNQVVNAIKLFYLKIENNQLDIAGVHRPKREKKLPNVLSKEEVKRILNSLSNVKHKAMLSLIYSCGLRRSELLNLKISDIDAKRNLIIIRQAKGKKDRIVPLSPKILELLRSYFMAYKPKEWLFEGHDKNGKYDERSLASVLKHAVGKSKISKPISLHWLRHSYATHLLENGTDLRYIQELLGHRHSTTTEIYTHVSNKSIQKIVSPFDSL